jgi:hypothetical protein
MMTVGSTQAVTLDQNECEIKGDCEEDGEGSVLTESTDHSAYETGGLIYRGMSCGWQRVGVWA